MIGSVFEDVPCRLIAGVACVGLPTELGVVIMGVTISRKVVQHNNPDGKMEPSRDATSRPSLSLCG